MMRNYIPLIHGIVDAFLFLETSGDDEVDPDSAVRCMEHIAASLLALEESDQIALRAHFEKIADDEQYLPNKTFIRSLPDKIGLAPRQ